MKKLVRYLSLYKSMFAYSLNRELQYRVNFAVVVIGYILYLIANVAFFSILYSWVNSVGGWSYEQILVFLGTYHIIHGLWDFGTALNVERISEYIAQGSLDMILMKPVSSLFYVVFRNMNLAPLMNVILGTIIVVIGMMKAQVTVTLGSLLLYLVMIVNGVIIFTMLQLILQLVSFWVIRTNVVNALFYQVIKFSEKPDAIYKGFLRRFFIFAIPMIVVVNFPSRVLLGILDTGYIVWGEIATILLLVIGIVGWRLSVKYYSSASS